jgi:hypothetical protein
MVYLIMFFVNLVNNLDHGSIPAVTQDIKNDLNLNNKELGSLGSLVFFGLTIGRYK